jgi:hypothetical protein
VEHLKSGTGPFYCRFAQFKSKRRCRKKGSAASPLSDSRAILQSKTTESPVMWRSSKRRSRGNKQTYTSGLNRCEVTDNHSQSQERCNDFGVSACFSQSRLNRSANCRFWDGTNFFTTHLVQVSHPERNKCSNDRSNPLFSAVQRAEMPEISWNQWIWYSSCGWLHSRCENWIKISSDIERKADEPRDYVFSPNKHFGTPQFSNGLNLQFNIEWYWTGYHKIFERGPQ